MRWEDFLADERQAQKARAGTLRMLDEAHCFSFSTGDATRFEDKGWAHQTGRDGMDLVIVGLIVNHRKADGGTCGGYVGLARPLDPSERERERPTWEVSSLDPLTISPSVLCHCGEHGFIRDGRWVAA